MDQLHQNSQNVRRREFSTPNPSLSPRTSSPSPYSAAPFIVYRSAKYSGLRARTLGYVTNARSYLKNPTLQKWMSKCTSLLYNGALVLLLIATIPFLLVSFCAIQIFRKLQSTLVKRYYPGAIICDDFSPRKSPKSCIDSDIVTSLIWVKGHLDLERIRSGLDCRIRAPSSPLFLLRHRLASHFRTLVWESAPEVESGFKIESHITQAPSKFHGILITDDPLRELSGASVLQKYVSTIISSPLPSNSCSPWAITLIPLPAVATSAGGYPGKQGTTSTLVLLRFHRLLLREKAVVGMFLNSLGQEGALEVDLEAEFGQSIGGQFIPCEVEQGQCGGHRQVAVSTKGEEDEIINQRQYKCWKDKSRVFWDSMLQGMDSFIHDCDSWIILRQRQAEFHSRLALGKLLISELSENLGGKSIQLLKGFDTLKRHAFALFQIFCGIFYCPKILLKICFTNRSLNRVGLIRKGGEQITTKSVAWSKQLSTQFLQEISSKLETSEGESVVFLAAVSLALKDYYQENCIQNPVKLGASISSSGSSSYGQNQKLVELPTRICDISKELNNLEEQVHSFSGWKQLGLFYLTKFSSLFLPQWIANFLVVQKLGEYYPIHLTLVDTHSSFPHLTFWGHAVQEFTFWRPPQSNTCISITLIKYGGTFRLSISSPMKSLDPFISQRFPQYLNQIAEAVGLDRGRIPYSRKSSPLSSNASSPEGAGDENDGSVFISNNSHTYPSLLLMKKLSLDSKMQSKSQFKKLQDSQLVKRFNRCSTIR